MRAFRGSRIAVLLALAGLFPWPSDIAPPPSPFTAPHHPSIMAVAIAMEEMSCQDVPLRQGASAIVPWCLGAPPRHHARNPEILAAFDAIDELKAAGFGELLPELTVVHFARSARDLDLPRLIVREAPGATRSDIDRAIEIAVEMGRSYYIPAKQLMAIRPLHWESEVRKALQKQFGSAVHFDIVDFPVHVSLYHEFGHHVSWRSSMPLASGPQSEAAADLFAAAMLARHYQLPFDQVARTMARVRAERESVENQSHHNAEIVLAILERIDHFALQHGPLETAFAAIRHAAHALTGQLESTAQAAPAIAPQLPACKAPEGFAYGKRGIKKRRSS
jgi:hypothetical protein